MHTVYLEMCSILEVTCLWTCHCWQVSCGSVHRRTLWSQAAKNDGSGVQRCFPRQASDRAAGTRSRTTAVTNPTQGQDHHQGREASLENPAMSLILQCNPKPCNLAFSYSTRNWILMMPLAKRTYGKEISRESSSSGIQSMRCRSQVNAITGLCDCLILFQSPYLIMITISLWLCPCTEMVQALLRDRE